MSALEEAIFERLYPRYRKAFGEPPPIPAASVDEVVAFMRSRLRAHANEAAQSLAPFRSSDIQGPPSAAAAPTGLRPPGGSGGPARTAST